MLIAQDLNAIQNKAIPDFKAGNNIQSLIANTGIIRWIIFTSSMLLLIYLVLGGMQLMFAKGDPKAMAGAWAKITNAVIGFIIVFMAYFLTSLISEVFGLSGFKGVFR